MNRSHSCTSSTTLFCLGAGGGEQSLVQVRWKLPGRTAWGEGVVSHSMRRRSGFLALLGS